MNQKILFVIGSLILVGTMVAFTVPSIAEAGKGKPQEHNWCYDTLGISVCNFSSHKVCDDARDIAQAADPNTSKCYQLKSK